MRTKRPSWKIWYPQIFLAAYYRAIYTRYIKVGQMMIKHYGLQPLLGNQGKDGPAAITHVVTHLHDPSLYISSEKEILLMIWAADAFFKKDGKSAPFYENYFYRPARALLSELHFCHLSEEKGKFQIFALFLDTKVRQTKSIFNSNMSLSISSMCLSDCHARKWLKKW